MQDSFNRFINIMEDIQKIRFQHHKDCNQSRSESSMLYFIHYFDENNKEVLTSNLSERLHISKSATSQTLNSLEDKGWIVRSNSKEDRRLTVVHLTPKGQEAFQTELKERFERIQLIFDKMGKEDSQQLMILLEKFINIVADTQNESNS